MAHMNDHKAKLMIMLLGKKKPGSPMGMDKEEPPEDGEQEPGFDEAGLHSAMEDFLKAVEEKDTAAMAESFKHAMQLCDYDDGQPEHDGEEADHAEE